MSTTIENAATSAHVGPKLNRRPFRAVDILKQVVIQGLAVSPDGAWVVYGRRTVEDNHYVRQLWRVPFGGGRSERLTSGGGSDTRPRFSPDSRSLLFTSDRSGKPQIWVMALNGGEPRQLTGQPEGASAADWSPDGKRILFVAPSGQKRFIVGKADDPVARRIRDYTWRLNGQGFRDEFNSIWVMEIRGGKPVRVTAPSYEAGPACWSPDGKQIAFLADPSEATAVTPYKQLWSVRSQPANQEPAQLASLPGAIHNLAWAPSRDLAFFGTRQPTFPGWANVDLFVSDQKAIRQLAEGRDLDICMRTYGDFMDEHLVYQSPLLWLDPEHVGGLVSRRGAIHPYSFGLDGSVEALADGSIVCNALAAGAGHVAVAVSGDGAADIYAVERGNLRRLTTDGGRWFGPFERRVEQVDIPHPDGHKIAAWFLRKEGGPRPTVIEVHGGPNLSFGPTPWLEMIALSDAGINVIWPNPRGSGGYGEAYARMETRWGDEAADDILRVVDWAVEAGIADGDRVGIMGLSQGGFMTNWMLSRHPGVFRAAVSENPVTDFLGEFGTSDAGIEVARRAVGLDRPWENLEAFLDRSPYTKIHLNHAPLLLMHCDQDLRCPAGQSEMVFTILRALGRDVEMIRYPDESHQMMVMGRPDRRVDRLDRILDWFHRHLVDD